MRLLMSIAVIIVCSCYASGTAVNLALHKRAAQSSTYANDPNYAASKGVDGYKYDTSMFHTDLEDSPWWEVDLGAEYAIDNVIMYNRVGCCQERIAGVQVLLSSDGRHYMLVYTHDNYAFRDRRVDVGGLRARFVRIQLPRRDYLHLQEVEVYQYGTWEPRTRPVPWTPVVITQPGPWFGSGGTDQGTGTTTPADWNTQANQLRGQNGQRYAYDCPAGGTLSGRLWGTGVYTDDSSVCTAAVHAGLITPEQGGRVIIEIRPGAASYQGSSRYGVTSRDYGAFAGSFVFVGSRGGS